MNIMHFAGEYFFNRRVAKRKLTELSIALQAGAQTVEKALANRKDIEYNRRVLNHIIGIERWGQSRLRVALGEAFKDEEYNGYRPPRETSWDELRAQFKRARAETIGLVGQIERKGAPEQRIVHNAYGALSVRGWLSYLIIHANGECKKMR
jgi:hypothetical protein